MYILATVDGHLVLTRFILLCMDVTLCTYVVYYPVYMEVSLIIGDSGRACRAMVGGAWLHFMHMQRCPLIYA